MAYVPGDLDSATSEFFIVHSVRPDLDGNQNIATYTVGFSIDIPLLRETAQNGHGLFFKAATSARMSRVLVSLRSVSASFFFIFSCK